MAANMSPELLKLLQDRDAQFYNKNGAGNYIQQDGRYYQPVYAGGKGGEDGHDDQGMLTGFHGYDQSWADGGNHQGEMGQRYNADGTFAKDYEWQDDQAMQNFLIPLMAAGAMYGFLPGPEGFGGAAGSGVGSGAGFVGEGVSSGIPAWDGALSTSLSGAYGPAGVATAAGQGAGPAAATTAASSGGGGGIFDTVTKAVGGSNGLLGIGSSILGGLLGGKGQQNEQTTTKDVPAWLKPYIEKQLGYAGPLLDKQMAPGYMQGYEDMRTRGMGLLGRPVARNPFGG